jgi:hypothetical protein
MMTRRSLAAMSAVDGWALVGTTFLLLVWAGCIVAGYYLGKYTGYYLGKYKGQVQAGLVITVILGPLGLAILAFIPRSHAARVAEAQKQYEIKAEAARRAGYPYPPQQSYVPYPAHPLEGQQPYPPSRPRFGSRIRSSRPASGSSLLRELQSSRRLPPGRDRSRNSVR